VLTDFFVPTRAAALERIDTFAPAAASNYSRQRNYDFGPGQRDNVSMLSPWIRHRTITEREVLARILEIHSRESASKFIDEIFWRTYWKGWLEQRPGVYEAWRDDVEQLTESAGADAKVSDALEAAHSASTGIECFDAWCTELLNTGYVHNHARMWFASIWIFTLGLPWQLGADFFMRNLLDGDAASNTLSWRWVAGVQTRGKHYLARPENIEKFTNGRFRPGLEINTEADPIADDQQFERVTPGERLSVDWRLTTGLLLTEDDLSPEVELGNGDGPIPVIAVNSTSNRSINSVSDTVVSFSHALIKDATQRLESSPKFAPVQISPDNHVSNVVTWALAHDLKQVVTAMAPTGPAGNTNKLIGAALAREGIRFVEQTRDWDRLAWRHATRGFFAFKKNIPQLLADNALV